MMNRERALCLHSKAEEQNICLEDTCLKNCEYKLDCYKCLKRNHPHDNSIFHISEILHEAQENQQFLKTQIQENKAFCENMKIRLLKDILEQKQIITQLIDQFGKQLLGEIDKYEDFLLKHAYQFEGVQLKKDQIKTLIDIQLLDGESFKAENINIQDVLSENYFTFNTFLKTYSENLADSFIFEILNSDELPKIQYKKIVNTQFQYERCNAVSCSNALKNQICTEMSCLQGEGKKFECPICLTKQHVTNAQMKSHTENFISAEKLWELQDRQIDEIILYSNAKSLEIENESKVLLQVVNEYSKCTQRKLRFFRKFIISKRKEITTRLAQLKTLYQKRDFIVHRDLLLMNDNINIGGDIIEFENKFKHIATIFKKRISKRKKYI